MYFLLKAIDMYFNNIEGFFWSKWLLKFINRFFFKGKRFLVEKSLYFSFFLLKKKLCVCSIFLFFEVLEKIKPIISLNIYKLKKSKVKKLCATPFIGKFAVQYKKGIFWLSKAIKLRKEQKLSIKIFYEFYDINYFNLGKALQKKKEYYKYFLFFKITKRFKW